MNASSRRRSVFFGVGRRSPAAVQCTAHTNSEADATAESQFGERDDSAPARPFDA
jgi:hypothetical protein